jgi:hypothetical protein
MKYEEKMHLHCATPYKLATSLDKNGLNESKNHMTGNIVVQLKIFVHMPIG